MCMIQHLLYIMMVYKGNENYNKKKVNKDPQRRILIYDINII